MTTTGHLQTSRAHARVDLSAVAHNVRRLREAAPDSHMMAVVKADGYGHGAEPVARAARAAGADWLGLALPSEAVSLRRAGIAGPMLAWLYAPGDDLVEPLNLDVDLSVSAPWAVSAVVDAARRSGRRARVHLKVDTGLGRGGAAPDQWGRLLDAALREERAGRLQIVGIWSHLACADEPESPVTGQQVDAFADALALAERHGVYPQVRHLANSAATLIWPSTHFDLVRCGISVYGLTPSTAMGTASELGLRPAMRVVARVALVKDVPRGQGVSYGLRYVTDSATRLALIPVGYADGVPRTAGGRLPVRVNGVDLTGVGTIAMDQFVLDVGDLEVHPGDEVVLFGDGTDGPTAEQWGQACGTINYEIVTRLGPRVPRVYTGRPSAE